MSINTNGTGGPPKVGSAATNASTGVSRASDANAGAKFREFVDEASATERTTQAPSAAEAYHSAIEAVARDIKVDDRAIDHDAIESVVELAVRAQFEGRLSEEELIERVEDAVFMLADDPSFAPATIEALRAEIEDTP